MTGFIKPVREHPLPLLDKTFMQKKLFLVFNYWFTAHLLVWILDAIAQPD
jgi:hypothetical protein